MYPVRLRKRLMDLAYPAWFMWCASSLLDGTIGNQQLPWLPDKFSTASRTRSLSITHAAAVCRCLLSAYIQLNPKAQSRVGFINPTVSAGQPFSLFNAEK